MFPPVPFSADGRPSSRAAIDRAEAELRYRRILEANPARVDARHMLGVILLSSGKIDEGLSELEGAVAMNPQSPETLADLGRGLNLAKDYARALSVYDRALRLKPDVAKLWHERGTILKRLQRLDDALASFDRALALRSDFVAAHLDRGRAAYALHRYDVALQSFEQSLRLEPNDPYAWHAHGIVLRALGRYADALASQDRALARKPDFAAAHLQRADMLAALGREGDALESYEHALALDRGLSAARTAVGTIRAARNDLNGALAAFDEVLAAAPEAADAHFQRALVLLALGRYEEAWPEFEWRTRVSGARTRARELKQDRWRGGSQVRGKTLFLYADGTHDQTLLLARYAREIGRRGVRVVLEVPLELKPVLAPLEMQGVTQVIAAGEPLPPFDFHCPLGSTPGAVGTTLASIPPAPPYLPADETRRQAWARQIPARTRPRVGLALGGVPRAALGPLLAQPVDIVGLEPAGADSPGSVAPPPGNIGDAAALVAEVDLVISADPTISHLAAMMGRPTWVLVPFHSDWCWPRDADRTPWYPTARLFRQSEPSTWEDVFARVASALATKLAGASAPVPAEPPPAAAVTVTVTNEARPATAEPPKRRLRDVDDLLEKKRYDEAEALLRARLDIDPNEFGALYLLGTTLLRCGQAEASLEFIDRALALRAAHPEANANRGTALAALGRLDEAIESFDRTLQTERNHTRAHLGKALALLAQGRFLHGWEEFEWRLGPPAEHDASIELAGKTLLFTPEATLADTIMFLRFVPDAIQAGARVVLELPEALHELAASIKGIERIVAPGAAPGDIDGRLSLGSLPHRLGLTDIPPGAAYLSADAARVQIARERIGVHVMRRPIVGLAWHASGAAPRLADVLPLAELGIQIVSLAANVEAHEQAALDSITTIRRHGTEHIADLAAAISALDLVVTADNVVAHLAGALGKPVWIMLPALADWRWMQERTDTPWYSSAKLFRQGTAEGWREVVARIAAELQALAHPAGSPGVAPADPYRLVASRHGPMLVNPNDIYVGRALMEYGEYAELEQQLLQQLWKPRPGAVVEVGANIGALSIPLARAIAAEGRELVCFEPQPFIFQNLCANLALNGVRNATALALACGDRSGELMMPAVDPGKRGNFGGLSAEESVNGPAIKVPVVRLDDALGDRRISLVKIDVVGRELQVLKGATRVIDKQRPTLYLNSNRIDRAPTLIEWLWLNGYQLWWHLPALFNPQNFAGVADNRYGNVTAVNLLGMPREIKVKIQGLAPVTDSKAHPLKPRLEPKRAA